jgi:NAD(P)-dependent dehydrogenase (short-subunit alcohol dehydrogenase family)
MGLMDGKVVIITGAGQGIGRSHALRFAEEGARLVINDIGLGVTSGPDGSGISQPSDTRDLSMADTVVKEVEELGGTAVADYSDMSTFAGGTAVVDAALQHFGRVDTLINNAGTMTIMMIGELDEVKVAKELAVHVVGYLGAIQAVWAPMIAQGGGTIVNTASGFGGTGPGLATYMAAKAGVFSLTRDAALEGSRYGIRCNSLTPAARTRMSVPYWGAEVTESWDPNWASTVALFLASDLSSDLSGKNLSIVPGTTVRESFISSGLLENDTEWTPESLASRIGELLHADVASGGLPLPPLGQAG